MISKTKVSLSASSWAQGGIAAVCSPEDSPELHAADTLRAGAGLCEPAAVKVLVEAARDRLDDLLRWGVPFDRQTVAPYLLATTLEAAHCRHRVVHVADATGQAVMQCLITRVQAAPNITVWEDWPVLDLCWANERCVGVVGAAGWLAATHTVLATGGAGQMYHHTTNPSGSAGDGIAIAWRSGVSVRDLEFVQFHPTALSLPEVPRALISEAVRGEGAYLVLATGERFMERYHPAAELAPRDVVSRALFAQQGPVYLDMRPIARLEQRFPSIVAMCRRYGLDPLSQPIPVAPAAHYTMGGVVSDREGRTDRPGLYAIGEVASTGVHGANRLASNSLLECLVFAYRASLAIATTHLTRNAPALPLAPRFLAPDNPPPLAALMWQMAGIVRDAHGLSLALDTYTRQTWVEQGSAQQRNLWYLGQLMLASMQFRQESRGGHYRSDYPQTSPLWQAHSLIRGESLAKQALPVAALR